MKFAFSYIRTDVRTVAYTFHVYPWQCKTLSNNICQKHYYILRYRIYTHTHTHSQRNRTSKKRKCMLDFLTLSLSPFRLYLSQRNVIKTMRLVIHFLCLWYICHFLCFIHRYYFIFSFAWHLDTLFHLFTLRAVLNTYTIMYKYIVPHTQSISLCFDRGLPLFSVIFFFFFVFDLISIRKYLTVPDLTTVVATVSICSCVFSLQIW